MRDLEKEKQIVIEEIRTVQDDPEDYIHELHAKDVMGNHPIGRPDLRVLHGLYATNESPCLFFTINTNITVQKIRSWLWLEIFHFPRLLDYANQYFGQWPRRGIEVKAFGGKRRDNGSWPETIRPHVTSVHPKTIRANSPLCVGFNGLGGWASRSVCVRYVMNTILGGGRQFAVISRG